jgi:hypothetical protein
VNRVCSQSRPDSVQRIRQHVLRFAAPVQMVYAAEHTYRHPNRQSPTRNRMVRRGCTVMSGKELNPPLLMCRARHSRSMIVRSQRPCPKTREKGLVQCSLGIRSQRRLISSVPSEDGRRCGRHRRPGESASSQPPAARRSLHRIVTPSLCSGRDESSKPRGFLVDPSLFTDRDQPTKVTLPNQPHIQVIGGNFGALRPSVSH